MNQEYGIKSWLLTVDHKRIALLYLMGITFFFFIGGFFALLIRLELLTPAGDLVQADTYNKLFTMHGQVMIFFFLIPAVPAVLGNFLIPIMIGAKDLAFPRINLLSWYIYIIGGILMLYTILNWRRGHGLDLLRTAQHRVLEDPGRHCGAGGVHLRLFFHPDGAEFHRHDPSHARAWHDLESACRCLYGRIMRPASSRCWERRWSPSPLLWWRWNESFIWAFSILRWAGIRCFSSICSGSIPIRRCTS